MTVRFFTVHRQMRYMNRMQRSMSTTAKIMAYDNHSLKH